MREFKLDKDYYGDDVKLYKKSKIMIEPGLTVLIGCNGAGKTTMIRQIKSNLEKDNIEFVAFDNLTDGNMNSRSKAVLYQNFEFLAQSMCSSEGENITLNVGEFAKTIGWYIKNNTDKDELWILLDAADSGLSVDAVVDMKEGLFNTIFETYPNLNIYIVVSANEYEMARNEKCFDVIDCKYVSVKSYEAYRKRILKSREEKDKRY